MHDVRVTSVSPDSLEMIYPKAQVLCDRHYPRRPCVICSL